MDKDLEDLEAEVREMGERILQYRQNIPVELKSTLSFFVASYCSDPSRLCIDNFNSSPELQGVSLPSPETQKEKVVEDGVEATLRDDQETSEKLILLRTRISKNVSSIPVLLGRMKACTERIDNLGQCKVGTHIAFTSRRMTDEAYTTLIAHSTDG